MNYRSFFLSKNKSLYHKTIDSIFLESSITWWWWRQLHFTVIATRIDRFIGTAIISRYF